MKNIIVCWLFLFSFCTQAQNYPAISSVMNELQRISSIESDSIRKIELDNYWKSLLSSSTVPIAEEDSVLFLYRGEAKTVVWRGDFNGWGYNTSKRYAGKQVPRTDIWTLGITFPKDARLDYKILVNDRDWIIDPLNPNQQWSGVGGGSPNSELRMPAWNPDPITVPVAGTPAGRLEKDILFNSNALGYQITYNMYYPYGYSPAITYPILYVTDGYEYLHERLGNLQVILDNLIHQKKIEPIVVVLIDHREPVNRSNNRRMQELAMNPKYLSFIADEFIPHLEGKLNVSKDPNERAILGTNMGGLASAYFSFAKPGLFGMAGIQSPAFWFKPEIYNFCDNPENPPVKIYMTSGTINDSQEGVQRMKQVLEKNTCNYQYQETNQGQSWGNWRDTIDDILIYFFPPNP